MRERIVSVVVSVMLTMGLFPTVAFAEVGDFAAAELAADAFEATESSDDAVGNPDVESYGDESGESASEGENEDENEDRAAITTESSWSMPVLRSVAHSVSAASTTGAFSFESYKAKVWSTSGTPSQRTIDYVLHNDTPSQLIVDADKADGAKLDKAIAAWRATHSISDPSKGIEYILDEKGYCEAIIFSVFLAEQESDSVVYDAARSVSSEANFLLSSITSWTKAADGIQFSTQLASLTGDEKAQLQKDIAEEFARNHPVLKGSSSFADAVSTAFGMADTVYDAIDLLLNLTKLTEMSDGMKATLQEMANKCPSSTASYALMKSAIEECALAMQNAESALGVSMINAAAGETAEVLRMGIKEVFNAAVQACPYTAAFMTGAKIGDALGTWVCNKAFSTDATIERFVKMEYLGYFTAVLRSALASLQSKYVASPNEASAKAFTSSVKALFSAELLSCDFATSFADTLYKDALFGLKKNDKTYADFVSSVAWLKASYSESYDAMLLDAENVLEADYPAMYELLFGEGSDGVKVLGLAFRDDEVTLDMDNYLWWLSPPEVVPNDATNKLVHYASSDPSILEIGDSTSCTLHRPGTVTVTATSDDGGFTDTVVVHVTQGATQGSGGLASSAITNSGKCGKNVYWTLNDRGHLSIYGTGDMYSFSRTWSEYKIGDYIKWFWYRDSIVSASISNGVTSVVDYAFYDCENLRSIQPGSSICAWGHDVFMGCSSLASLDLSGWDASSATDMGYMFYGCSSLTSLNLSGWDTSSVTSMHRMFYGCSSLASLDLSGWDMRNVVTDGAMFPRGLEHLAARGFRLPANCGSMFAGCISLREIEGCKGWDASHATSMRGMFGDCSSLTSLDLSGWDTSSVADTDSMFSGCSSLTSLDLSGWGTSSVADMGRMFCDCPSLVSLDLSGWDTSSVTIMSRTFYDCSSLAFLDLSGWNVSSVTDMDNMFTGCSSLSSLDLSGWDMRNVTISDRGVLSWSRPIFPGGLERLAANGLRLPANCGSMFFNCESLREIEGCTSWDASSVKSMYNMFSQCSSLTSLDLSGWDTSSLTDASDMFRFCPSLASLDLSGWSTSSVADMGRMFCDCPSLVSLDLSGWDTSSVTIMSRTFYDCSSLAFLDLSGWNVSSVTDMDNVFTGCSSLSSLDLSGWDMRNVTTDWSVLSWYGGGMFPRGLEHLAARGFRLPANCGSMFAGCISLREIEGCKGWDASHATSMRGMFGDCSSLTSLDLSGWDTSSVIGMSQMFEGCSSLVSLDLSRWNSISAQGMSYMFSGCSSLASLDLSGWDASSATDMGYMFYGCSSLTSLNLSGWDTSSVTSMHRMFYGCSSLASLDLSGWDTSSVTGMSELFYGCSSLASLGLSGWETSSVTDMGHMFSGCSSLQSLDLSGWDVSSVKSMSGLFDYCGSLGSLDVSGWDMRNVTESDSYFSWSDVFPRHLERLIAYDLRLPADCEWMLFQCSSLCEIEGCESWDTSNVEDMGCMFCGCSSLTSLDISDWDTSNVEDMGNMFYECSSLAVLSMSEWDTSSVASMREMFEGCSSLTSLDLSGWDTSNVGDMGCMFLRCSSLARLDLSGWDMSKTEDIHWMLPRRLECLTAYGLKLPVECGWMFGDCSSLCEIEGCGSWDASSTTNMYEMFCGCSSLTSLDLSGWDTSSVESMDEMFSGCSSLASFSVGSRFVLHGNDCYLPDGYWLLRGGDLVLSAENLVEHLRKGKAAGTWERVVQQSVSSATVSGLKSIAYTGGAITPVPEVEVGGKMLKNKVDYTLSYSNNTNAGIAKVTITGIGDYAGSITKDFKINPASISSVSLKAASATYDGKTHKPAVKAVKAGSFSVSSSGYKVEYLRSGKTATDFKSAGSITVRVTGKGNFAGSRTATFKINQAANPMSAKAVAKAVKLPKGKKALAKATPVTGAVKLAKKAVGAVTYAKVAKGSAKCLTINKKTGKVTVAKGTKAGTYKLNVTVKAAGNKNYKAKTQTITLTVRVK